MAKPTPRTDEAVVPAEVRAAVAATAVLAVVGAVCAALLPGLGRGPRGES